MNTDVTKLMSTHEVTILGGLDEFEVKFYGPEGTPYEGGVWKVRVNLPEQYPFMPPKIIFSNMIYHPNISELFGTVCMDVIDQAWRSASYDLSMIFEYFLPQLLTYPNPFGPLNWQAAIMYRDTPEKYKEEVSEYVQKYATEEALRQAEAEEASSESITSDFSQDEAQ